MEKKDLTVRQKKYVRLFIAAIGSYFISIGAGFDTFQCLIVLILFYISLTVEDILEKKD